jgi:hypothetical protein
VFAPPSNLVPVFIGAGLVVVSAGVAIAMSASKSSAQDKANQTSDQIKAIGGTSCNPPSPANLTSTINDACSRFVSDNNDVNTDATIGNLALGAGIVFAAATVIYWALADKGDEPSSSHGSLRLPSVTPIVGRQTGGLTLSGSF